MHQELERAKKIPKISVVIRKRPLSQKEASRNEIDIIEKSGTQTIIVKELKQKVDLTKYIEEHSFNFDYAFGDDAQNQEIYGSVIQPLVSAVFTNATCTCFAYGQTGSGKTHTMLGNFERGNPGLYLLASDDLFKCLLQPQYQHLNVWVSFYEIYCGKLFDLLNERQELQVREDAKKRVNIVGLSEKRIQNVQNIMNIIEFGNKVRVTGVNSANSESSRSHAILSITVRENNNTFGKLSFIDLAGSERGADVSDSNKQTRIDGAEINKSLLALKECIRAIDQNKNHTPFRGSKLTQVLRDSFVGNCKTVMIGNISPSQASSENTLNTLRYADRVKELKKPSTNQLDAQVSELDKFSKELMLPRQGKNTKRYSVPNENATIDYTKSGAPPSGQQVDQNSGNNVFNANGQLNLNNNNGLNLNNMNGGNQSATNSNSNNNNNNNNNVMNKLQNQFTKKRVSQPQTQNLFGNAGLNNDSTNNTTNNTSSGASGMDLTSLMQQRQQNQQSNTPSNQNNNNNNVNLINNTTNNLNVMNNNNLNQLNQMNGNNNNNFMEQEIPYQNQPQQYPQQNNMLNNNFSQQQQPQQQQQQQQNGMFQNNSGLNLNKKAPLQNSNSTNQIQQNNFMKNPSNLMSMNVNSNNNNMQQQQQQQNNFGQFQQGGNNNGQGNFQKENNAISMNIEQIKNWTAKSEEDLQMISQKHEQLISLILAEEEDVISGHRGHIDDMVDLVKQEMMLLHEVDKPGSDVDEYVTSLDSILAHKIELIANLRGRLKTFKDHLKEEETLSKKFYEQRSQILDVFDLNQQSNNQNTNNNTDEMQLLDDL